jgi:hypothetical protein
MTYYESAEGQTITRYRAFQELAKHGLAGNDNIIEFIAELGDRETYDAQDVLAWLGY